MTMHLTALPRRLLLLCMLVACAPAAQAVQRSVRVCVADQAYLPISLPQAEAPGQRLVRLAIEHQGDRAEFVAAPWLRCLLGLEAEEYDGVLGAAPNPSFAPFMRFPMRDGKPDARLALANVESMVLRRRGDAVAWDGKRFTQLDGPVLYATGLVVVHDKLQQLELGPNLTAKTPLQLMRMLAAGRSGVAIVHRAEALALLARPEFHDKVEMLPVPFLSFDAYLGVRRGLHETQPAYVQAIWADIGRLAATAESTLLRQRWLAAGGAPPAPP